MISGFLADPFTFRQCCEVLGTATLADLIRSRLPEGHRARTGIVIAPDALGNTLNPIASSLANEIVSNPDQVQSADLIFGYGDALSATLDQSMVKLEPGGVLIFLGYCGSRHGPGTDEIATISSFIASLPVQWLDRPADVTATLMHPDFIYPGSATIEGRIEAYCRDVTTVEMGGLLTYPLWAATVGRFAYQRDEEVAFPLMAQVIERRLMAYRMIGPGVKLIVGYKS